MVHIPGSYLPDLNSITCPLYDLLKDDTVWAWGPAQEEAFVKMKMLVASTPILAYYDATKSTCVSADASSYGIGGVLMQDHGGGRRKPVAFCSRMLTPAEQRYAQIEKECFASVWAYEKCELSSRSPNPSPTVAEDVELHVHMVESILSMSPPEDGRVAL